MNNILFEYLKQSPIFANLEPHLFQTVETHLAFQELQPNEYLFKEGEHGDYIAFVLVGELVILKGINNQIGVISEGDCIGEMALLDTLTRSAAAMASKPTALVTLSKKNFQMLLTEHPKIGVELFRGIANLLSLRLRRTTQDLSNAKQEISQLKSQLEN